MNPKAKYILYKKYHLSKVIQQTIQNKAFLRFVDKGQISWIILTHY